jgi:hypothetical protein
MAINGKYSVEQRKIAREIYKIVTQQKQLRNNWLELDIRLSYLKKKIDYGRPT